MQLGLVSGRYMCPDHLQSQLGGQVGTQVLLLNSLPRSMPRCHEKLACLLINSLHLEEKAGWPSMASTLTVKDIG